MKLDKHEKLEVELPDGSTLHLFCMGDDTYTCVDAWRTRGRSVEPISQHTGDESRAPMGLFAWRKGTKVVHKLEQYQDELEKYPGTHGWPPVSTVSIIWDKE